MAAEQSLCIDIENVMATVEQMQEALQQIHMLTARITTVETQLQFESVRAQTAEQERSALIQTLVTTRQARAGGMVDTKGIGKPFMWKGSADQDFAERSNKVRTFMLARFGDDFLTALACAARQRKMVAKTCVASQRNRMISWNTVFGEQAGEDEIENIDDFVGKLYAYLVSFTIDAPNRIVRNSGEGNGLEAWRRLHSEYDIVHETCGDPATGPEPTTLRTSRGSRTSTGKKALKETSVRDIHRQERTAVPGI